MEASEEMEEEEVGEIEDSSAAGVFSDGSSYKIERQQFYSNNDGPAEFSNRHVAPRVTEKTIIPDMLELDFPDYIKVKADEIYNRNHLISKKSRQRKFIVFSCVLNAYIELGIAKDPNEIANVVGIPRSAISKASSTCNAAGNLSYFTPTSFIESYAVKFNLPMEDVPQIQELAEYVLSRDADLADSFPQTVAAAIVYYYMTLKGYEMTMKEFASQSDYSEMTISKRYKKVMAAHVN